MVLNALSLLVVTVAVRLKSGNCSPMPNILSPFPMKLRLLAFSCSARSADALQLNTKLLHPEAGRDGASQLHRGERIHRKVGDGTAAGANQMMMGMAVGVDAPRAMMRAHFVQHAGMHKGLEVLVNRRE